MINHKREHAKRKQGGTVRLAITTFLFILLITLLTAVPLCIGLFLIGDNPAIQSGWMILWAIIAALLTCVLPIPRNGGKHENNG